MTNCVPYRNSEVFDQFTASSWTQECVIQGCKKVKLYRQRTGQKVYNASFIQPLQDFETKSEMPLLDTCKMWQKAMNLDHK